MKHTNNPTLVLPLDLNTTAAGAGTHLAHSNQQAWRSFLAQGSPLLPVPHPDSFKSKTFESVLVNVKEEPIPEDRVTPVGTSVHDMEACVLDLISHPPSHWTWNARCDMNYKYASALARVALLTHQLTRSVTPPL